MSDLQPLTSSLFGSRIRHGFFGRVGGRSEGLYRGLNCSYGSDDDADVVSENRARVAATLHLTPDDLLTVHQTHSSSVLTVTAAHNVRGAPQADATVTNRPGIGLAILTADCAPIFLADENAGVIGAAHAGWRGAIGGIIENTVAAMAGLGARAGQIRAAIGPTISQANYEVDTAFRERFVADDPGNERYFAASPKKGHCHFDLPAYCAGKLVALGIERAVDLKQCTYADEAAFFSYRRATHRGEADYGRNISVISLAP